MTQVAHTSWEWLSPAEETGGGSTVMIYPAADSMGPGSKAAPKRRNHRIIDHRIV